jgi:hypothetical protein
MYIKIEQNTIQEKDHKIEMYSILSSECVVNMSYKISGNKVEVTLNKK